MDPSYLNLITMISSPGGRPRRKRLNGAQNHNLSSYNTETLPNLVSPKVSHFMASRNNNRNSSTLLIEMHETRVVNFLLSTKLMQLEF